MPTVLILPVIDEDGSPTFRLPHWKMPFLQPKTVYQFKPLSENGSLLRVRSAWYEIPRENKSSQP